MRGKQCKRPKNPENYRITPADAGKTCLSSRSNCRWQDHPRGCGENVNWRNFAQDMFGSPPRMRGKQLNLTSTTAPLGITPADAGKTQKREFIAVMMKDHPRGCGENVNRTVFSGKSIGSPPRMRGKPFITAWARYKTRITPADAGKTIPTCANLLSV